MFELILAVIILTSPQFSLPETQAEARALYLIMSGEIPKVEDVTPLRRAMKRVGKRMDLIDPRESYIFSVDDNFFYDLKEMQDRYKLTAGAPPLSDMAHFPSTAVCVQNMNFNSSYREYLGRSRFLFREDQQWWFDAAIQEAELLYEVYEHIKDAQSNFHTWRKLAELKWLKEKLKENYWCLPPCVPIWRFEIIYN